MIVRIVVHEHRHIPNDRLLELAAKVREKWELPPDSEVLPVDLLIQAQQEGIVTDLPDITEWDVHRSDEHPISDEELREIANGPEDACSDDSERCRE